MQIDEERARTGLTITIDFEQLMRENEVLANSIQLQYHKVYPYIEKAAQEYVKERIGAVGMERESERIGEHSEFHAQGVCVLHKSPQSVCASSGAK